MVIFTFLFLQLHNYLFLPANR